MKLLTITLTILLSTNSYTFNYHGKGVGTNLTINKHVDYNKRVDLVKYKR